VRPNDAGNFDPRPPFLDIPLEVDLGKQRVLDRLDAGREDLKHRAGRLILAGEDVEQRFTLGLVGALVEDRLENPLAVMERPRQIDGADDRQGIKSHISQ
jgi:hypothetical protein